MFHPRAFTYGLLAAVLFSSAAFAKKPPPKAAISPVTDDYFVTKVVDTTAEWRTLKIRRCKRG